MADLSSRVKFKTPSEHFVHWTKQGLRAVDRQPLWGWMENNLRFKDSPYGQRFRIDATPWLKAPLEAQQDIETQEVIICAAAQMGKTVLIQGGLAWSLSELSLIHI